MMKKTVSLLIITIALCYSCKSEETGWVNLIDTNFTYWDNYLSYPLQEGYNGKVPKDKNGNHIAPIGLNKPGYDVFSVVEQNKETILRISGEIYGCVVTKNEYENYHLKLQTKWGDLKTGLRKNKLKDSGILYHSIGPHGFDWFKSWMMGQEFQIMEGHHGDYWSQINTAFDVRAYPNENMITTVADHKQPFIAIGKGESILGYCLRSVNNEKPNNEWNTLELICFEGKSIHIVNGEVVMVLKNSRYIKDEHVIPLTKGKIQLQSEGAETFYKNIKIKELYINLSVN